MKTHETKKQWYLDAIHSSMSSREKAERDRDYYDNKQWTATEEAELAKRKQPVITKNRIKPKVDSTIGLEIQSRVDIKGFPRNPQDEKSAEAVTDALRYVADNTNFDQTKTECAYNMMIEGTCAGIVEVEEKRSGIEITPKIIPWDRFFIDQHSSRKDGKDARFMGQAIWMDAEEALEMFPDADPSIVTAGIEDSPGPDTYEDKPKNDFYDRARERVKIIEMYYQEKGTWYHCFFTGLGNLTEPEVSQYLDEDGEPCNPIECQRAFLDRDNNPYGAVRQMISPQDEINKRSSKALHLLSVRQVKYEKGAVDNVNKAKLEFNKPDGWIEVNPNKMLDIEPTSDLAVGQMNLLQEAKREIDAIGANAAVTGKEERTMSGRALQVRQQAGAVELQPVFDGLRNWELRMYRQSWARIKQYWTVEKWVRVTDDEANVKFVGLNRPVTLGEKLKQQGQPFDALDPVFSEVVDVENNVAELDIDIILDTVPDAVTLQSETFEAFAQAAQASGTQVPLEIWLELMPNVPNRKNLLDKLNGGNLSPEEQQQRQQQAEMQRQREEEAYEIEKQTKVSEIQKNIAEVRATLAKAAKEAAEAEAQEIENDSVESGLAQLLEANG